MKVSNLKVKTPSIPSRSAANQFIDENGYDMEWVPSQNLFYIHDTQKDQLHCVDMGEVTNFKLKLSNNTNFMKQLRTFLQTASAEALKKLELPLEEEPEDFDTDGPTPAPKRGRPKKTETAPA